MKYLSSHRRRQNVARASKNPPAELVFALVVCVANTVPHLASSVSPWLGKRRPRQVYITNKSPARPERRRGSLLVAPDQVQVLVVVEVGPRAPLVDARDVAVEHEVTLVYRDVVPPREVRRELRGSAVLALERFRAARVTRVLYTYAPLVVLPVPRVPGYVLVADALGYLASHAHDVVRGDVGARILEPPYGARV